MVNMQVNVSDKAVKKALRTLGSRSGVAISRAANRAATTANKTISAETRERYIGVKAGDVKKALFKRGKATSAKPFATLEYRSGHDNLYKTGDVSPKRVVKTGRGHASPHFYKARVMRGRPFVALMGRPRPFVQEIRNPKGENKVGLFRRKTDEEKAESRRKGTKGTGRNAIVGVAAPALVQMMKNKEVLDGVRKEAGAMFEKRLEHEIDHMLKS